MCRSSINISDFKSCAHIEFGHSLSPFVSRQLLRAAPYLTGKQVEHLLRHANVGVTLRQRLKFLLGLKRRVEKVAQGCFEAILMNGTARGGPI